MIGDQGCVQCTVARMTSTSSQPVSPLYFNYATQAGVLLLWTWSDTPAAYFCSDILPVPVPGYGHATRVSAFASALLNLDPVPVIYIVSSAPKHIFSQCTRVGAVYRYAEIDPVIAQPLA